MTGCSSVGEQHTSVGRLCLCGLLGYLHLVVASHEVVELHLDNCHKNLRLDHPFPALQEYVESIDQDGADNTKHGNIPYLVLLFKYLEQWKGAHDGQFPSNYIL